MGCGRGSLALYHVLLRSGLALLQLLSLLLVTLFYLLLPGVVSILFGKLRMFFVLLLLELLALFFLLRLKLLLLLLIFLI